MSGLILLLALIACGWAGFLLVRFAGRMVPSDKWRNPVTVGLTLLLLATPFVDEVIGMYQFKTLCKTNGIESADISMAKGRRVKIHDDYSNWNPIFGYILPIEETQTLIKDSETDEVLSRFKNYRSKGGWLMRVTPIGMGSPGPILFGGATCDWTTTAELMKRNDITWIKN